METPQTTPPLPDGMLCAGCGYEVGGLTQWVCPECGRIVDDEAVGFFHACSAGTGGEAERDKFLGDAWVVSAALGLTIGMSSVSLIIGFLTASVTFAGYVVAVWVGTLASRQAAAHRRRAMCGVWMRHLWRLSSPLLGMACGLIPIGLVGVVSNITRLHELALLSVASLVVLIWLIWTLYIVPLGWLRRVGEESRVLGLRSGLESAALYLAAVGCWTIFGFWSLFIGGGFLVGVVENWSSLIR